MAFPQPAGGGGVTLAQMNAAIAAASVTDQAYTDTEVAAALITAAADATTKANTAETDANTYTDGEIATLSATIPVITAASADPGGPDGTYWLDLP